MVTTAKSERRLDNIDRRILRALQEDGRISYVSLAEKVSLSTSPCLERVKRLERDGFISGYTARLNPELLDAGLLVFVQISLNYTSGRIFEEFRDAVRRWPQILECHLVAGEYDYLLKVRISDMSAYRQLLGDILQQLPGVSDSRTLVAMETVVETSIIEVRRAD
jgi:Lrp/AsnC family transcriptional regulator, leucine-responsive regulatory protein